MHGVTCTLGKIYMEEKRHANSLPTRSRTRKKADMSNDSYRSGLAMGFY
jgi:hypothetical protein